MKMQTLLVTRMTLPVHLRPHISHIGSVSCLRRSATPSTDIDIPPYHPTGGDEDTIGDVADSPHIPHPYNEEDNCRGSAHHQYGFIFRRRKSDTPSDMRKRWTESTSGITEDRILSMSYYKKKK